MMHQMQSGTAECINVPAAPAMMHAATQDQLHHRCIKSGSPVKPQVNRSVPRSGARCSR
jgi:hypothetical protein